MPVWTMASPSRSAAAVVSSSRIEPPGCTMAVTPASPARSMPSANGKKASDARAAPVACSPAACAASATLLTPVWLAGPHAGDGPVFGDEDGV